MFDLLADILLLVGAAHLVVCVENRFSALRPEPDLREKENHQPGRKILSFLPVYLFFFMTE